MTDYLLVECIINNLVQNGIIAPPRGTWKKTVMETQFYYADFFHAATGSLISLRVSVINGNHVVSVTAFINQARFFSVSPEKILEECKL